MAELFQINGGVAAKPATKAVAPGVFFFSLFRGVAQFDSSAALSPLSVGALGGLFFVRVKEVIHA